MNKNWKEVSIFDVVTSSQGIQVPIENQFKKIDSNKVRFIRISDYTKKEEIPRYVERNLSKKGIVDKDDVVMIRYGEAGRVCRGLQGLIANNLFLISPTKEITKEYLFYLLSSRKIQKDISNISASSAMPAINFSSLSNLKLLLPPLPEQKKIAEILSGIDNYLARLKECFNKYRILKTALLNALIPSNNDLSEKTYSTEWKICSLEEVCSLITYGFTNPMPTSEKGIPMVTAKDIKEGLIDFDSARCTTEEAYFELLTEKSRPERGDVLVTKDGTLGRTAIVNDEKLCINQSVALLRPLQLEDAEYIHLLLSSPFYQRMMISQSGGTTIKHIYITTLAKMQIIIPENKSFQEQIVKIIKQKNLYLNSLLRKIQHVENIKKGLSSDLLSGRKRVQV